MNRSKMTASTTGDDGAGAFTSFTEIDTGKVPGDTIYGLHLKDGVAHVKATINLKTPEGAFYWPFALGLTLVLLLFAITGLAVAQIKRERAICIVIIVLALVPITAALLKDQKII
jgi:hypothetical protein